MVLIPEKEVLLTRLKTEWPFWPYYGQIRVYNYNLCEDNFTSQFYVKRGGDSRKSSLIDHTVDKMAIFGHIMAKFGQVWV